MPGLGAPNGFGSRDLGLEGFSKEKFYAAGGFRNCSP
jgi:hypothetical protein